jgi:hypothetical protein
MRKTVITSAQAAHYIGFADLGWLWVSDFNRAHTFMSKEEAEQFVRVYLPSMTEDVWYLRG